MCEAIEDSGDLDKLGQGFTSADPLEKIDIGDGTIPRPTFVNKNLSAESFNVNQMSTTDTPEETGQTGPVPFGTQGRLVRPDTQTGQTGPTQNGCSRG